VTTVYKFCNENVSKMCDIIFLDHPLWQQVVYGYYCKDGLNNYSFCLRPYCIKLSILFGWGSDNKMLYMSNAKLSWRHLKDLKYTAVIAQNSKQKVITNLHQYFDLELLSTSNLRQQFVCKFSFRVKMLAIQYAMLPKYIDLRRKKE